MSAFQLGIILALASGVSFSALSLWARVLQEREGMVRYFCYFNLAPMAVAAVAWAVGWAFPSALADTPLAMPQFSWPLVRAVLYASGPAVFGIVALGLAFRYGHISHVAPVMGGKALVVTVISVAFGAEAADSRLWVASAVLFFALYLLSGKPEIILRPWRLLSFDLVLILLACAGYGASDVITRYQIATYDLRVSDFLTLGWMVRGSSFVVLLVAHSIATRKSPLPKRADTFLLTAVVVVAHALLFVYAMRLTDSAILVNILSALRGLVTIAAVWLLGHLNIGRYERLSARMIVARVAGSLMICLALYLALSNRTQEAAGPESPPDGSPAISTPTDAAAAAE